MHQQPNKTWSGRLSEPLNRTFEQWQRQLSSQTRHMRAFIVPLLLTLSSSGQTSAAQHEPLPEHLKHVLATQGFSGELHGKVRLDPIGSLNCGSGHLNAYFYEWEETNAPGQAVHASYRVLLFRENNQYLGSYAVSDRPKLTAEALVFDYPKEQGNIIKCNQNKPPQKVLLNGELQEFGR